MICRTLGRELPGRIPSFIRSFLYIGLFTYWWISLNRRVMQTQTRRLLGAVAALMVFWIVCRTVKYFLVTNPDVGRYLWYLYYFPMLFIPFLSVFVAFSLGKPENYRLPLWSRVFYAPVTVLLAFVLTNDLHQTVFVFPPDEVIMSDSVHTYGVVYFIVVGCMAVCAFIAFAVMILKWPRFTRT